jgi:hypothetical protein
VVGGTAGDPPPLDEFDLDVRQPCVFDQVPQMTESDGVANGSKVVLDEA